MIYFFVFLHNFQTMDADSITSIDDARTFISSKLTESWEIYEEVYEPIGDFVTNYSNLYICIDAIKSLNDLVKICQSLEECIACVEMVKQIWSIVEKLSSDPFANYQ